MTEINEDKIRIKMQYENARHYFIRCIYEGKSQHEITRALEHYRKISDKYFSRRYTDENIISKLRELGAI